jgi:hypothetical protein
MSKYSYTIEADQDAGNPRDEFDNISEFYGSSSRYNIGGKQDHNFRYRDDLDATIKEFRKEKAVIVEFFSSEAGDCYAVIERDQLQKEYLDHGYSMRKALYWARRAAQGEIDVYLAWANGEVYGYRVTDNETGEELDSCWGFYGYEFCKEEAESTIKFYEKRDAENEKLLEQRIAAAATL